LIEGFQSSRREFAGNFVKNNDFRFNGKSSCNLDHDLFFLGQLRQGFVNRNIDLQSGKDSLCFTDHPRILFISY